MNEGRIRKDTSSSVAVYEERRLDELASETSVSRVKNKALRNALDRVKAQNCPDLAAGHTTHHSHHKKGW